jgi:hypothetical protein
MLYVKRSWKNEKTNESLELETKFGREIGQKRDL